MSTIGSIAGDLPKPACQAEDGNLRWGRSRKTVVGARTAPDDKLGPGEWSFQALVDAFYSPLFRFAMSLTRTEHDAADLVQDTFLAWATKGHQLLDRSKAKAWLFTTLHRRFLQGQRRITRFPHFELTGAEAELPNVEPELVNHLDSLALAGVIVWVGVDEQFQAAVALFYLEDYSYQEIATILEVPLGTVKSRIARGLGKLKELVLRRSPGALRAGEEKL